MKVCVCLFRLFRLYFKCVLVQLYNEALNQINLISTNFKTSNENQLINLLRYWLKKTDFDVNVIMSTGCSAVSSLKLNEQVTDDSDDVESQYLPKSTFPFKQTYD
jgi:hypothetical protein